MKSCKLNLTDFESAFGFGTAIHLSPAHKNKADRTTGSPRSLGAILDNYSHGKLVEIGVGKLLKLEMPKISFSLDLGIHPPNNDPDIIAVQENGLSRDPYLYLEVKRISSNDRWLGLKEEQFQSIERAKGNRDAFIIFASITQSEEYETKVKNDLTGIFLKEIEDTRKTSVFQEYAKLDAEITLEYIISTTNLKQHGVIFEKGMDMYESMLFREKKITNIINSDGSIRKGYDKENYHDFVGNLELSVKRIIGTLTPLYNFSLEGNFEIFKKGGIRKYIRCLSAVTAHNPTFGKFDLNEGKVYTERRKDFRPS